MSPRSASSRTRPLADLVIRDARLVTVDDDGVIARGWIATAGKRIVAMGAGEPRVRTHEGTLERRVHGRAVLPGFVDPHTHLLYAGRRYEEFQARREGVPYVDILAKGGGIHATVAATRKASDEELAALLRDRLARAAAQGTTTIEVKSGYGLEADEELRHLRLLARVRAETRIDIVPTYLALHALPAGADRAAFVRAAARAVSRIAREKLADRVDAFVETAAFSADEARIVFRAAARAGLALTVHADQFTDLGGAAFAASVGARSADHLAVASDDGLEALSHAKTVAVLLPGSALVVGYAPPQAKRFRAAGVRMALATDQNPGTSPIEGMPIAIALGVNLCGMTPDEAITAATRNAAAALGRERASGSLRIGKRADLVVLETDDERDLAYRVGARLVGEVFAAGRQIAGQPAQASATAPAGPAPRGISPPRNIRTRR